MSSKMREKMKTLAILSLSGTTVFGAICIYKGNEKFYRNVVMPVVHLLDGETSHKLGIIAGKYRLYPKSSFVDPDILKVNLFGKSFINPVGIAAGFDKNGEAILGLQDVGFGFVEIGSVTPEPQPGNDKPRLFRLVEDEAVINRYGFNSDGHSKVLQRIQQLRASGKFKGVLGINLGQNKTSPDPVKDYVKGIQTFGPLADYLVINISSPNTPGLRSLQAKDKLQILLMELVKERNNLPDGTHPPLLLKLAPDLTPKEMEDIADVVKDPKCRVDGFIVSNTTVGRPEDLKNKDKGQSGGLSGKPLRDVSTRMISDMYRLTNGMPIIGSGGISSGKDAYDKIKAGACAVQLYTAIVYDGPPVVTKVKRELAELLAKDGCGNLTNCVAKELLS